MGRSTDLRTGHIRSGDEPTHARSALRMRLWLTIFGLANGIAGVIVFHLLGSTPFMVAFAAFGLISAVNLLVVARHIRQGAHYQPGRTIPPYRPVEDSEPVEPPEPRKPPSEQTRRRRYFALMILCLLLIIFAWGVVRFYSVAAAGAMTLVAALIPPFAAIITNANSPIIRGGGEWEDEGDEDPGDETGDE
jgi:Family of unknown function (DUF6343)